jgi:hypothetical protein
MVKYLCELGGEELLMFVKEVSVLKSWPLYYYATELLLQWIIKQTFVYGRRMAAPA